MYQHCSKGFKIDNIFPNRSKYHITVQNHLILFKIIPDNISFLTFGLIMKHYNPIKPTVQDPGMNQGLRTRIYFDAQGPIHYLLTLKMAINYCMGVICKYVGEKFL